MTSEFTPSSEQKISFSMEDFEKALDTHDYVFQKGQVVRGKVFEYDSNGAYIDMGGKSPGFVPMSEAGLGRVTHLSEVLPLEQEAEFLIIREQDAEGRVTLSRRQLLVQRVWEELAEMQESGKSLPIYVTGVNRGGVTGEVQGLRGFIPRSHLMEQDDLDSLVGQNLTATLLEVNPEQRKLVLSQREAARANVVRDLEAGQLLEGKVSNVKPYGVFIDVGGITGLLHIKHISGGSVAVESLEKMFPPGRKLQVAILQIDEWKNRISLTTKILEYYPGEILEQFDQVMATAEERLKKNKAEAEKEKAAKS